jgi:hypothetical protein
MEILPLLEVRSFSFGATNTTRRKTINSTPWCATIITPLLSVMGGAHQYCTRCATSIFESRSGSGNIFSHFLAHFLFVLFLIFVFVAGEEGVVGEQRGGGVEDLAAREGCEKAEEEEEKRPERRRR